MENNTEETLVKVVKLTEDFKQYMFDVIFREAKAPKTLSVGLVSELPENAESASLKDWEALEPKGATGYKRAYLERFEWIVSEADGHVIENQVVFINTSKDTTYAWPIMRYAFVVANDLDEGIVAIYCSLRTPRMLMSEDNITVVIPMAL